MIGELDDFYAMVAWNDAEYALRSKWNYSSPFPLPLSDNDDEDVLNADPNSNSNSNNSSSNSTTNDYNNDDYMQSSNNTSNDNDSYFNTSDSTSNTNDTMTRGLKVVDMETLGFYGSVIYQYYLSLSRSYYTNYNYQYATYESQYESHTVSEHKYYSRDDDTFSGLTDISDGVASALSSLPKSIPSFMYSWDVMIYGAQGSESLSMQSAAKIESANNTLSVEAPAIFVSQSNHEDQNRRLSVTANVTLGNDGIVMFSNVHEDNMLIAGSDNKELWYMNAATDKQSSKVDLRLLSDYAVS